MAENRPVCAVCGGTEYCVEAGFYYCSECQTQSQDIREEVFERWNSGNNDEPSQGTSSKRKKRKREPDPDREWTTWEAYNWILKGLVDEVIELGAKPSLKEVVLQLWASYLRKMGIAFTSKKNQEMPKLAVDFDPQDASLICGIKIKSETSSRKSSSCKSIKSASSVSQLVVSSNSSSRYEQKKKFLRNRRKLMAAEAERVQQDAEATLDFSSQLEHSLRERESSVETTSIISCSSRSRGHKSEASLKQRKKLLRKICGAHGMYNVDKHVGNSELHISADPNYLCRTRLLNFIHLGLLIDCNEQQLSDLLRWIREGHLSFQRVSHFFPDEVCIMKNDRLQFDAAMPTPHYSTVVQGTGLLTEWLEVTYLPVPVVHQLIERQIHELGLPDMMITLVEQLSDRIPVLPFFKKQKYFYSFEVQIMAMIIFVLKLLLGLDDRTEYRISETADRLNELQYADNHQLFSWDRWMCWFEKRKQLLIRHHIPTRDLIEPREKVDTRQLIEQWKRVFKDERLSEKVKTTDYLHQGLKSQTVEILKQPLLLLAEKYCGKSYNMYFPATLTPLSTYSTVITTHMCTTNQDYHWKNFSTSDMNFMLDPSEVLQFAESKKIKLKILKRSAHSSFKRLSVPLHRRHAVDNVLITIVPIKTSKIRQRRSKKKSDVLPLNCHINREEKKKSRKKVKNKITSTKTNYIQDMHSSVQHQNCYFLSKDSSSCKPDQPNIKKGKDDCSIKCSSGAKTLVQPHFGTRNNFYLKSKEFLKFHIETVTQKKGITRQPTVVEQGEVGLATAAQRKSIKKLRKKLLKGITSSGRECLKLYLPYRHYWICSGSFEKGEISEEQFKSVIRKLPVSFNWLLQECARLLEVEKRYLYCELLRVEGAALCIDH